MKKREAMKPLVLRGLQLLACSVSLATTVAAGAVLPAVLAAQAVQACVALLVFVGALAGKDPLTLKDKA